MQQLKSVNDFLFRPDFERFGWANSAFYIICLSLGVFFGSFVSVLIVSSAVYALLHQLSGRLSWSLPAPVTAVSWTFCGFFGAEMLSALINPSMISLNETIENLPFLGFAAIYAVTRIDRELLLRRLERSAACAAILGAVIATFIFDVDYRPELATGNPGIFSLLSSVLLVILTGAVLRQKQRLFPFFALAVVCAAYMVVVAGSRSMWLSLLVVPLLGLLAFRPLREAMIGSFLVFVLVAAAALIAPSVSRTLESRIDFTVSDIDASMAGNMTGPIGQRLRIYQAGVELFLKKPVFGYGPGNEREEIGKLTLEIGGKAIAYSHAHNVILNVALRDGVVGLVALVALVLTPIMVAYRAKRDATGQVGLFFVVGLMAVYLCAGTVGLMLGNDIHDAVFIAGLSYGLYLVFGRAPAAANPAQR